MYAKEFVKFLGLRLREGICTEPVEKINSYWYCTRSIQYSRFLQLCCAKIFDIFLLNPYTFNFKPFSHSHEPNLTNLNIEAERSSETLEQTYPTRCRNPKPVVIISPS